MRGEGTISAALRLEKPLRPETVLAALDTLFSSGEKRSPACRERGTPPAVRAAAPPANDRHEAAALTPRILVAEDNAVNRQVALRMLQKLGYAVDVAEDGREVLAALARADYRLILMDCQMPEMDGFVATTRIREREHGAAQAGEVVRRIPIVALTANAMRGDRERCLAAGMDDYIPKPVTLDGLREALARWLA